MREYPSLWKQLFQSRNLPGFRLVNPDCGIAAPAEEPQVPRSLPAENSDVSLDVMIVNRVLSFGNTLLTVKRERSRNRDQRNQHEAGAEAEANLMAKPHDQRDRRRRDQKRRYVVNQNQVEAQGQDGIPDIGGDDHAAAYYRDEHADSRDVVTEPAVLLRMLVHTRHHNRSKTAITRCVPKPTPVGRRAAPGREPYLGTETDVSICDGSGPIGLQAVIDR